MNEKNIYEILKVILNRIQDKKFIWRLEGSANLKIQGVEVSVRDLDISTTDEGIGIFRDALKDFVVKDFFSEKIHGPSLICNMHGFEIEINSYGDRKWNMFDKTKNMNWNNLTIPILPLKHAKVFYELINRHDKVELISKYIN